MDFALKGNNLADTGRKRNVDKTFRRCLGRLWNFLCTLNLRPVSMGKNKWNFQAFALNLV